LWQSPVGKDHRITRRKLSIYHKSLTIFICSLLAVGISRINIMHCKLEYLYKGLQHNYADMQLTDGENMTFNAKYHSLTLDLYNIIYISFLEKSIKNHK
jgi:hypothetical protein